MSINADNLLLFCMNIIWRREKHFMKKIQLLSVTLKKGTIIELLRPISLKLLEIYLEIYFNPQHFYTPIRIFRHIEGWWKSAFWPLDSLINRSFPCLASMYWSNTKCNTHAPIVKAFISYGRIFCHYYVVLSRAVWFIAFRPQRKFCCQGFRCR